MHKLRLLKLLLLSLPSRWRGRPNDFLRPVVCRFFITPLDVELTHAVSHTYLSFAGLGRWCWNFHNLDWRRLLRERWTPFTHSELVYYRRSAKLFSVVEMSTQLIWWDEKMAYFEHRLTQGATLSALVYSRGACYAGKQRVEPGRSVIGAPAAPPMARPGILEVWAATDHHFQKNP